MNSTNNSVRGHDNSNNKRIDGLEPYYKPVGELDDWISRTFWLSAVLSVVVLFEDQIPWTALRGAPELLFLLAVLTQLIFSLYLRFYIFPKAELKRRRQLVSDSLGVALIPEKTQMYYNNELAPSMARLGANVLENSFFAKAISNRMVNRERVITFSYFLIWILAVSWRRTDLGLVVIITQTLFSSEVIEKWLRLEFLCQKNENYYDQLYDTFLHKVDFNSPSVIASIIDTFASYEVTKGMAGVRLSESIFTSMNPKLSVEWDDIRNQLGFGQDD